MKKNHDHHPDVPVFSCSLNKYKYKRIKSNKWSTNIGIGIGDIDIRYQSDNDFMLTIIL